MIRSSTLLALFLVIAAPLAAQQAVRDPLESHIVVHPKVKAAPAAAARNAEVATVAPSEKRQRGATSGISTVEAQRTLKANPPTPMTPVKRRPVLVPGR